MTANIKNNLRKAVVLGSIAALLTGCRGTMNGEFETFTDDDNATAAVTAESTNTPDITDDQKENDTHSIIREVDHNKDKKDSGKTVTDSTTHTSPSSKETNIENQTGVKKDNNTSDYTNSGTGSEGDTVGTQTTETGSDTTNPDCGTVGDAEVETNPDVNSDHSSTDTNSSDKGINEKLEQESHDSTDNNESVLRAAEENNETAQQNVKDRQSDLDSAIAEREAAQTRFDELNNQTPSESQYEASLGTLGFFESMRDSDEAGYEAAKAVFDYASSDSVAEGARTCIGADDDATSLENGMKAIRYLEECNEIRERDGLEPLSVTLRMMAIAQVSTNADAYFTNHWSIANYGESLWGQGFDFGGENASFGTSATSDDVNNLNYLDPFHGWYDKEKAIYDGGDTDFMKTGHYQNIVNSDYVVTGIGYAPKGSYGITEVQDFDYSARGQKTYTVAEYKELYNNYYQAIVNSTDSNENQAAIEAAQAELDAANQKVLDAQNALAEAITRAEIAAQELADTQQKHDSENQTAAERTSNSMQNELEESAKQLEAAKQNDAQAKQEVENAENALSQKQEEKEELEKELAQLQVKQSELEARIEEAEKAVNEAQEALTAANENAETAARELADAQNEYDAKQQAADSSTENNAQSIDEKWDIFAQQKANELMDEKGYGACQWTPYADNREMTCDYADADGNYTFENPDSYVFDNVEGIDY